MRVNENHNQADPDSGPRLHIKSVARRLFALRGVHNVTVREIAREADQRNLGVVAYYFGTKDSLIAEILIEGAERIERRRQRFLETLTERGGPESVYEAVEGIVRPCVEFADTDPVYGRYFNSFLFQLSLSRSEFIDQTLEGRWNTAYQTCLTHLRHLLPHLSRAEQNRRFLFLGSYVSALLAQREIRMEDALKDHPTWTSEATLNDIIGTAAALLTAAAPSKSGQSSFCSE
jgi:AcrR family transcriptional regulator